MHLTILRLDHRLPRDERITTHVALVARAFGADEILYTGQHDTGLGDSVKKLVTQWGGEFRISYERNWKKIISSYRERGYLVVHLTMYGLPLLEVLRSKPWVLKTGRTTQDMKLLIIVGGPHVPGEIFQLADYNMAVTSQPHSEVAALAIFLNELMKGEPLTREFNERFKGKVRIEPSERGKKIIS